MKTPTTPGQPISTTIKTITKEVRMVLTDDQLKAAITEWLIKNIPQFRNMPLEFDWLDNQTVKVIALRETEETL